MLCSRKEYVDAVGRTEETTHVLRIAADKGNDDNLGLLAFEIVDTGESHALEKG